MSYPPQVQPPKNLKQRSPSQPSLPTYLASKNSPPGPPPIPLRMSSIPANSKPRKLSLPIHRSTSTLKAVRNSSEEKENVTILQGVGSIPPPPKVSPPIRKNKALPSPPMNAEEELRTREKVGGSSPQQEWSMYNSQESPQRRTSDLDNRGGKVWTNQDTGHPGIAELPAVSTRPRATPSRLNSAPTSATLHSPYQTPDVQALASSSAAPDPKSQPYSTTLPFSSANIIPPLRDTIIPKAKTFNKTKDSKARAETTKQLENGNWAAATQPNEGRPVQMSRTQRDKERKKRSKAAVLMEHVDIIKDEFWEKRPWILSGKTG
jgi:hypothetical protein